MEYCIIVKSGDICWVREYGWFICNEVNEILWLDGFIMDIIDCCNMENELFIVKDVVE